MQIFVDLDTRKLRRSVSNSSPVTTLDFKRGDTELMEIFYVQNNAQVQLAAGAVISFGAKIKDAYDGAALVFEDDFTLSGSGATAKYSANPSFNTVPLDDALMVDDNPANDLKLLDLMGEITWNDDGVITSSVTFAVRVNNDVLRGDEGTPTSLPDPADWMPAALTFAGADPNAGSTLLVTGITSSGIGGIEMLQVANHLGFSAWESPAVTGIRGVAYMRYVAGDWNLFIDNETLTVTLYAASKTSVAASPVGLVFDAPTLGTGIVNIAAGGSLQGTHLGQLCKASAAWWRWNGTAWVEEIPDASLTIAKTAGLQAALGKVIHASTYGASPSATAAANVTAIQAALDAANTAGGGTVVLDGAGDYSVNATLTIGSKTRLHAYGATLKKTATFGEVLMNKNAGTLTRDTDISIVGLTIKVNSQSDTAGANVAGMRGNLTFVKVDRLTVEDFQIPDMGINLFGVHIHDWSDVSFTRCRFVGAKVGIQMGSGTRATIDRCYFECHDDAIALLTREWVTIGTSIGDLTDVVVSNCIDAFRASQTGFFARITSGAWATWASGFSYGLGDTVVSAGKIYRMTNGGWGNAAQPAALIVSSVAPTHSSGSVTGADGIAWQYYRAGTDTESHVRRLTFRNNQYLASRPAVLGCVWEGGAGAADRSTSPGNVNLPEISGITIDGGSNQSPSLAQTLIYGHANVTDIAISNFHDANTGGVINLVSLIGFTSSTDPRTAHTTRVVMSNCRFAGTGNRDVNAQRQLLTLDLSDVGSRFDSPLGYLSQASSTGIISIARSDVPWQIGVRIKPKSFNSSIQTLVGPYDALYGQWLNRQQSSMLTYALDAKTTKVASGTAAVADVNDNGINVNAGTTATGSAYVRLLRGWGNDHTFDGTGGINFAKSWIVRMRGQGQAVSGAIRWYMAGPTAATLANANTFTALGIGWELGVDGGEQAIRLVYHNGSPQASAWHKFGHAPARSRFYDIAIAFDGLQKIELYATSVNGNTAANPAPAAARITVTDGPTGSGSAGNSFCNIAAVADGSTAPAANDIAFALRSSPILVFP